MKQVKIDDNSYLLPEEKHLFKHVIQLNEKALAWNADERGFFCSDYFSWYKMATVPHAPWVEKNIPIPMGHQEQFVQIIQEKINAGVYKQSQSFYWSAYFCVIKKDSSLCLVHDLQPLNGVSIWDTGQAPLIDDFVNDFAGQQIYTVLDMFSGYNTWLIHPESRPLTAFQTPSHGLLQITSLPMGYTNSVPEFQNCMNLILQDKIASKAGVFIDDIGIKDNLAPPGMDGWKTEVILQNKRICKFVWEHTQEVHCILHHIACAGGTFSVKKVQLVQPQVLITGQLCIIDGRLPDTSKMSKVAKWPTPTNIPQVCGFLGLYGTMCMWIKDYSTIVHLLIIFIEKNNIEARDAACQESFEDMKKILSEPPVLVPMIADPDCRVTLAVNIVLWRECYGVCSSVWKYAPGSTRVAEQYGDPVDMWPDH
jgi:hypothetical protein